MENRIRELENALSFYAKDENWDARFGLDVYKDCGQIAREVLDNGLRTEETNK